MKMNSPSPSDERISPRAGFSLVEVLVTLTILITLAAIILAITGRIRLNARQSNAVSAMRQIGIANVAYQSENNGAINVIRDAGERGTYEGPGAVYASNSFMGRIQPYLFPDLQAENEKDFVAQMTSSLEVFFGTSELRTMAKTLFSGVPVTADGSGIRNPLAVNMNLRPQWGKTNPPFRVSEMGNPASTLYLTYGRYYFNAQLGATYTPLPQNGDNRRAIYYLPNKKGVFCFLDGHVELLSAPIPERLFGDPDRL